MANRVLNSSSGTILIPSATTGGPGSASALVQGASLIIKATHAVQNANEPYHVYEVQATRAGVTWIFYRRYRQIHYFASQIAPFLKPNENELLPQKKVLGKMEAAFVKQRTAQLQSYFDVVNANQAVSASSTLASFIDPRISPALVSITDGIKEGYLCIQENLRSTSFNLSIPGVRTWKLRWCILSRTNFCLYLFKTREAYATPKRMIELSAYCSIEPFQIKTFYCMKIQKWYDDNQEPLPILRSETLPDLLSWCETLKHLIAEKSHETQHHPPVEPTHTDILSLPTPPTTSHNLPTESSFEPFSPVVDSDVGPVLPPKTTSVPVTTVAQPICTPTPTVEPPAPEKPAPYLCLCRCLYDYSATEPRELTFSEGDIIQVISQDDSGWWQGRLNGKTGWFPSNFVEVATEIPLEKPVTPTQVQSPQPPMVLQPLEPAQISKPSTGVIQAPPASQNTNTPQLQPPPSSIPQSDSEPNPFDIKTPPLEVTPSRGEPQLDPDNPFLSLLHSNKEQVKKVSYTADTLLSQLSALSVPGNVPVEQTAIKDIRATLAKANHIPDVETERYGLFLNDSWMDETPQFKDFGISATDRLSFARMKKPLARSMKATTQPANMQIVANSHLEGATGHSTLGLLPGEKLNLELGGIIHIHSSVTGGNSCINGVFYVTNFRLFFKAKEPPPGTSESATPTCFRDGFEVPIASLYEIQKGQGISPTIGRFWCIVLRTKDFHDIRFCYRKTTPSVSPSSTGKSEIAAPDEILEGLVFHNCFDLLFALNPDYVSSMDRRVLQAGWSIYNPILEYRRIGVPNEQWRLTELNCDYTYCKSYPGILCVPTSMTDVEIQSVFAFRSKGRIPALIWQHAQNHSAILRCGQPGVGITGARCFEDEKYVAAIGLANTSSKTVYIIDARPRLNARANQLKGMGYELEKYYENCAVRFAGIENIHKMRESESKLRNLCLNETHEVIAKRLESTKWLQHLGAILSGAFEIVQCVENGYSVLVHCSDGWDRTSQLTSLALLICDPFYRTLQGFEILIEKEWISFGHMFCSRTGHIPTTQKQPEKSPVFAQFIDCVWQLMHHLKNSFEFNQNFLAAILFHLYSCQYGTFLFDSELDRLSHRATQTTQPLWAVLNSSRNLYVNPDFKPELTCSFANMKGFSLSLWDSFYLRWKNFHEGGQRSFSVILKEVPHWFQV